MFKEKYIKYKEKYLNLKKYMHGGNYDDLTFVYNDSNTFDEKYFLDALNFGLNDRGFKEDLFKIIDKGDGVFDISKTKIIQRCNCNLSDHNYQIYEIKPCGFMYKILNWNVIQNYSFFERFYDTNNANINNPDVFNYINLLNNTRINLLYKNNNLDIKKIML